MGVSGRKRREHHVVRLGKVAHLLVAMIPAVSLLCAVACGSSGSGGTSGDPFAGAELYVDPGSSAARAAAGLRDSRPDDAAELDKIARNSQADWFGDWDSVATLTQTVAARRRTIRAAGALPVFVVYDIPLRDCHGNSGGGATSPSAYRLWIRNFVAGLARGSAAVIVEPDALAQLGCLRPGQRTTRLALLRYAVRTLASQEGTAVYLDAGHAGWVPVRAMAERLRDAGVADARGFSLNVSNFDATAGEQAYGRAISSKVHGRHFVIDTSRNGLGPGDGWCNPPGRALGHRPTGATGHARADAYLWIKPPGESDGPCNGGPQAGEWWTAYAVGLAERARW
jgi:endoglucanase